MRWFSIVAFLLLNSCQPAFADGPPAGVVARFGPVLVCDKAEQIVDITTSADVLAAAHRYNRMTNDRDEPVCAVQPVNLPVVSSEQIPYKVRIGDTQFDGWLVNVRDARQTDFWLLYLENPSAVPVDASYVVPISAQEGIASLTPPGHPPPAVNAAVRKAMDWLRKDGHAPEGPVKVVIVSPEELFYLVGPDAAPFRCDEKQCYLAIAVLGLPEIGGGTVMLADPKRIRKLDAKPFPLDQIMVHELTHLWQGEQSDRTYLCPGQREFEAYKVQSEYAEEHGQKGPNLLIAYLMSDCAGAMNGPSIPH